MEDEEHVEPQEQFVEEQEEQVAPELDVDQQDDSESTSETRTMVPLSALQKQRQKTKELELELQWERQRKQQAVTPPPQPEDDRSKYESATREDLSRSQEEAVRIVEERIWIKSNPEKHAYVDEHLQNFLKQRPNLTTAIMSSTNRYEEAYTLMNALTPKQQQQMRSPPVQKRDAPNAPTGVPKAAALNQAVDVMSMSDSEFTAWRQAQKRRR